MLKTVKWRLRDAVQWMFPRAAMAVFANRSWVLEPEVALIPCLSPRRGLAVDAGVNKGVYLYHLSRTFRSVVGFEPHPGLASYLKRSAPANAVVHGVALSSEAGRSTLRLPADFIELGSLEQHTADTWTTSAPLVSYNVDLVPLDAFALDDVAFVKIDVEGHELAVLHGADATITRWRPSVLIEVEERHRAGSVAAVQAWFEARGYAGYFLDGASVRPLADFDLKRDQDVRHLQESERVGRYINNFMFFDRGEAPGLLQAIAETLARREKPRRLRLRPAPAMR